MIKKYFCETCGHVFYSEEECREHESICCNVENTVRNRVDKAIKKILNNYEVAIDNFNFNYLESDTINEDDKFAIPTINVTFDIKLPDGRTEIFSTTQNYIFLENEIYNIIEEYILPYIDFNIEAEVIENPREGFYADYFIDNKPWSDLGRMLCGRKVKIQTLD